MAHHTCGIRSEQVLSEVRVSGGHDDGVTADFFGNAQNLLIGSSLGDDGTAGNVLGNVLVDKLAQRISGRRKRFLLEVVRKVLG